MSKKKKRVELQIDIEKDYDVVQYLENSVDNQAGFIKNLLRQYVRGELVPNKPLNRPVVQEELPVQHSENIATPTQNDKKQPVKRILPSTALSSMSSKDLNIVENRQES